MKSARLLLAVLAVALTAACSSADPTGPGVSAATDSSPEGPVLQQGHLGSGG
jgi:uncharacterized lipoprotein